MRKILKAQTLIVYRPNYQLPDRSERGMPSQNRRKICCMVVWERTKFRLSVIDIKSPLRRDVYAVVCQTLSYARSLIYALVRVVDQQSQPVTNVRRAFRKTGWKRHPLHNGPMIHC